MTTLAAVLDVDGPAAPPRRNGELVFAEPWESRAFGLALGLHAAGAFEWEAFRTQLISAVADWERDHPDDEEWNYYRCWLTALEAVLGERGVLGAGELDARTLALAGRPKGHDHLHTVQATEAGHDRTVQATEAGHDRTVQATEAGHDR